MIIHVWTIGWYYIFSFFIICSPSTNDIDVTQINFIVIENLQKFWIVDSFQSLYMCESLLKHRKKIPQHTWLGFRSLTQTSAGSCSHNADTTALSLWVSSARYWFTIWLVRVLCVIMVGRASTTATTTDASGCASSPRNRDTSVESTPPWVPRQEEEVPSSHIWQCSV